MNMCPFSNSGENYWSQDKTFGITVEAFEDKVNLDKAIQCPEDLWECPTQAILVGVVKDTAQEEPIIPEAGVEETTQVPDDPAQHFDDNLPSQLIDEPLIETFIIKDKIREHDVRIVISFTKCYIKLIYNFAILHQL